MMSLQEELRELVLSDKLPEILRMLAKTFHDRAEEHEKKMKEFNPFGDDSPESPYRKEIEQYVWWAHRGFELEGDADHFEREIQDRDLTASERDQKQRDKEIRLKEEELARLKARRQSQTVTEGPDRTAKGA